VSALIEAQFGFELHSLNFGRIEKGQTATQTAVLILKDQSKRNLLEIGSQSPYIALETTNSADPDQGRIEVQISVNSEAPAGRLNETIVARLSDNSHPASNLSIRGSIVGKVEIIPEAIGLTADTSQSAADQGEQSVRVVSTRSDFRFELKSVNDPNGYLSLEVDTIVQGQQYIIKAKPSENALRRGRNLAGEVKVLTSDAEQPEVTFRYNIIFARR